MKGGKLGYQHMCKACMVAYHRQWRNTEDGRAKMRAGVTASKRRYPEKQRARHALTNAIRDGKIQRGPCYAAGPDCAGKIEGHHHDYAKPYAVTWVCRKHHRELDRERRSAEAAAQRRAHEAA